MAQILTVVIQLAWRGEVSPSCIREVSKCHIGGLQRECEILVRLYGIKVFGTLNSDRRQFVFANNHSHGNSVT